VNLLAGKNSKIKYSHQGLAVSDLTHLLIDEALPVAEAVGVEWQYKRMAETGEMDFKKIEKYLNLLHGKPQSWVAERIDKAEPFAGSKETINYLKEMGYETVIVTDDALMSLPECNDIVNKKLGADKIIPTAEIEYHEGKIGGGLKNTRTKPQILREIIELHNPLNLLCMVQGLNDYEMAASARKIGGTIISVNSHSQKLESVSHHHIDSIAEAPGLLTRILQK